MKPLIANDYLTEHIDHEECAALLVLEPLDVVDRTSKHQAWSRSPLNTGNGKPNPSATACLAERPRADGGDVGRGLINDFSISVESLFTDQVESVHSLDDLVQIVEGRTYEGS